MEISSLPPAIVDCYYFNVVLSADIIFVNGIQFFMTISQHHIQFATCEMITNAKTETIVEFIKQVIKAYSKCKFKIDNVSIWKTTLKRLGSTPTLYLKTNTFQRLKGSSRQSKKESE